MGAPFSSSLKKPSGGGITPANYYAVANNGFDLAEGQATVPLIFNADEGAPYAALNADTITMDIVESGIFVIATVLVVAVTGAAAAPSMDVTHVLAFTTADSGSLAESFSVNGNLWGATIGVDQSTDGTLQVPFTTPPMALAAGDSFQWFAGLSAVPAAGAVFSAGAEDSGLVVVKLG